MTQQFKAMKIRIKDEQHSRLVQKALFEMGYKWLTSDGGVEHTNEPYVFAESDGNILYCDDFRFFLRDAAEEVELVTTYSFRPVDQEAKRKAAEKEASEKNVAEMQKQLDEMKQKLDKF